MLELQETHVIEPRPGWSVVDWRQVWAYRELLYFLTWRDVKVRYKQAVLGAAWAILQPLATMIAFSLIFGRLAGLERQTGDTPYPIFVFAGLLPWTFFASALAGSSQSVVNNAQLVTKVYFPRIIVPLAAVGTALVDFGVSLTVLLLLMAFYRVELTWQVALLPLILAGTALAAAGVGTFLSALNVAYRDFQYVVPFLIQLWMFVTPVIYPLSIVPERWRWVFWLNPMAGLIEGFRAAILGRAFDWASILVSCCSAALAFFLGAAYFRAVDREFADII